MKCRHAKDSFPPINVRCSIYTSPRFADKADGNNDKGLQAVDQVVIIYAGGCAGEPMAVRSSYYLIDKNSTPSLLVIARFLNARASSTDGGDLTWTGTALVARVSGRPFPEYRTPHSLTSAQSLS